jgi:hypothetical protein
VLDYGAVDGEFEGWRGGGRGACFGDEGFEDVVLGLLASGEGLEIWMGGSTMISVFQLSVRGWSYTVTSARAVLHACEKSVCIGGWMKT